MRTMTALVLATFVSVVAVTSVSDARVSGFVDTSYSMHLGDPAAGVIASPLRLYDADFNSWTLNTAHIAITGGFDDSVDYVLDIDVGNNASMDSAFMPSGASDIHLQEAYIKISDLGSGLGMQVGKFATTIGIEVLEAPDNPVFSHGYLFTYAMPATHSGVMLTYDSDMIDAKVGVVNGWDLMTDDNNDQSVMANVKFEQDMWSAAISYISGQEDRDPTAAVNFTNRALFDLILAVEPTRDLDIMFEYLSGTQQNEIADDETWSGFALEALYKASDVFSIGFRYESFDDPDGVRLQVAGQKVSNIAIAPTFALTESTTLRVELRLDTAENDIFPDDTGPNATDTQNTIALEVYSRF